MIIDKISRLFKIILIIAFIVAICGIVYLKYDSMKIGERIDSYKNVDVYYNGILYTKAYGKNYDESGYYYGQKWQCVEYIKRFYHQAKGVKMPDVYGNAKDFFDPKLGQGQLNKGRGLIQYRNGDNVKPQPDDLLVFTDTSFGHVAIVTEVASDYIEVIQQNVYGQTRARFELVTEGGNFFVGKKRKPAGWLRKE